MFFVELCSNFLLGTHEYLIYTFHTKYISGMESNVWLYKKVTGNDRRIIIALKKILKWTLYKTGIDSGGGGQYIFAYKNYTYVGKKMDILKYGNHSRKINFQE